MPVLAGLGSLTLPWRESVVSSSARVHLAECGSSFRPGAAAFMDWLGRVSADDTSNSGSRTDRLAFADVAFGWVDNCALTDDNFNVLVADLSLARSLGASTVLGVNSHIPVDNPFVTCLAAMADIVRTGPDAASCLAAARSAICDRLYLTLRAGRALTPSLAEQSFWRAHRELRIPELQELVPELEVRFPSGSSGQRLVKRYDFAVLSRKILVEIDGSWHDRPDSGRNDRLKDELAESYGWSVMRFRSQHVLAGPDDAVREVAARVARAPVRLDASLDVRTMPTVTADGWTFGHARDDRFRPVGLRDPVVPVTPANPDLVEDVTLALVGGTFINGPEPSLDQISMLRQVATVFDVDVDKVLAWLASSSVGDRMGPFSWSRGSVRRLFFVHHLARHVPSEKAVLGGAVMPKGTSKDPVVIAVREPFSGPLRSALRHVMHLPKDQIATVLSGPHGVLTRPVKTLTGPPRLVSFIHAPKTDTALAWEVASWWNRTIRSPMRTFTLDVRVTETDLSAELSPDLLAAYPTLASTARAWLAGRRETCEAVSKDFPRTKVILRRADATNTELRDMLANPHLYQPTT